jgi:hypothetical protein
VCFIGAGRAGSYPFNPMRCVIPSLAVGFLLSGSAASLSAAVIAQQGDAAKGGTAAKPQAAPPSVTAVDNDAAAKHTKRTLCLKESKAKKLVGAHKTSYIKDCMSAS